MVARQQAQARDEQRRLNAELRATRALPAESARVNERTRSPRALPDLLAHHPTSLSLHQEASPHITLGTAQDHVATAPPTPPLPPHDVTEAATKTPHHKP